MADAAPAQQAQNVAAQRRALMTGVLVALPLALAAWGALYAWLPPLAGMDSMGNRLAFALKCCCVAVLLCLFMGIEAVAHQRLGSAAIDPLQGAESPRLEVDLRCLQNTLEQLLLFVPGLLGLALYCADGRAMRAVAATTVVWIVARYVFWIGYHKAPRYRAPGLVGMLQSALVLLYVCGRFGHELAGLPGTLILLALCAAIEARLVWLAR
ncbi:MAPEG family protein [Rhodanobacter sp. Si-c]|uniref:MAPEG family protein n=1 Tax=Rhodanobacter lycopersici TaxID=3162487 RepID=A0ABV3QBA1_9GAMM